MLGFLRSQWEELRAAFWTLPALITAGMIGLALLLLEVDRAYGSRGVGWAFGGDAEAARGILSTISGSLITVAGLTFSITIVTLQLVSGQFTPRAVRGFMADRVNQSVAGAFVGMFAYCLIVLRSVRAEETDEQQARFVPALAVSSAIALALAALALLILFIHHMGQLIQVSHIAARIGRGTLAAVDRLYPETFGRERSDAPGSTLEEWRARGEPDRVHVSRPGFVRRIDEDRVSSAVPDGTRVHIAVHPGEFVTERRASVEVWPAGSLSDEQREDLARAVEVETERDLQQDAGFGIRQLADIALRALSPGVNDPTTAVTCVGYLQAALERLARRAIPHELRELDRDIQVLAARPTFTDHLHAAFGELSPYAAPDLRVAHTVLDALAAVAAAAREAGAQERANAVVPLARELVARAREHTVSDRERRALDAALARVG